MDLIITILPVVTKGSSHLSPVHALHFFLSRCKFSALITRQPMVEFYLLTFPRFPLRKKQQQVNNGVVYLDYEDSPHHGPLLCCARFNNDCIVFVFIV